MATQGIVSVLHPDGAVALKLVAGCNGYKAQEVADALVASWPVDGHRAYQVAAEIGFGSRESLVVLSDHEAVFGGEEALDARYRDTFQDASFNPRWRHGTASYVVVVSPQETD